MFQFHFRRTARDLVSHLILILAPVLIITFFYFIFADMAQEVGMIPQGFSYIATLTIGFALSFQIFGSALSFETLGGDFLAPMRDRLMASPTESRKIVVSVLLSSSLVSFLQTLAVITASALLLGAELGPLFIVLPLYFLSVVFNQLFGSLVLFLSRSVKTANTVITVYGAVAPMAIGLYFPLPQFPFFDILRTYLSPLALANTAIHGAIEGDYGSVALAGGVLLVLSGVLYLALRPLVRRLEI